MSTGLIACHDCDLLHRLKPLPVGTKASCTRCGALLYQNKRNSIDRALAWSLAALVLFVLANVYPFMTFKLDGREQEATIVSGVTALYQDGMWGLAALVLLVCVLAPLAKILGLLYVLLPIKLRRRPPSLELTYRAVELLHPWSMLEVYLLGVLVALVKIAQLATIVLGPAFYAFIALIITSTAAGVALDAKLIWDNLERAKP